MVSWYAGSPFVNTSQIYFRFVAFTHDTPVSPDTCGLRMRKPKLLKTTYTTTVLAVRTTMKDYTPKPYRTAVR